MVSIEDGRLKLSPGESFWMYIARAPGEWDDHDGIILGVFLTDEEAAECVNEYIAECDREFDEDEEPWVDPHIITRGP